MRTSAPEIQSVRTGDQQVVHVLLRLYSSSMQPARSIPAVEPRAPMTGKGAKVTAPLLMTGSVGQAEGIVLLLVGFEVLEAEVDLAEDWRLLELSYLEVDNTASAAEEVVFELDDIGGTRDV